jgi:hypothetical protein
MAVMIELLVTVMVIGAGIFLPLWAIKKYLLGGYFERRRMRKALWHLEVDRSFEYSNEIMFRVVRKGSTPILIGKMNASSANFADDYAKLENQAIQALSSMNSSKSLEIEAHGWKA